jgi:hypothetical protein
MLVDKQVKHHEPLACQPDFPFHPLYRTIFEIKAGRAYNYIPGAHLAFSHRHADYCQQNAEPYHEDAKNQAHHELLCLIHNALSCKNTKNSPRTDKGTFNKTLNSISRKLFHEYGLQAKKEKVFIPPTRAY